MSDVAVYTPSGEKCLDVGTLGVGIHLWKLIYDNRVEITYAEIIGLDGRIWKKTATSPLNIDFMIKAFSPKDKNKPSAEFDIKLYNVVIRKSRLSYDVRDIPEDPSCLRFDVNHIALNDLKADVALPVLRNDDFIIDLRRLSFIEKSGVCVEKLGFKAHVSPESFDISDIVLRLPASEIQFSDINLCYESFKDMKSAFGKGTHHLHIKAPRLSPSDFCGFFPPLAEIRDGYVFDADFS